MRRLYMGRHRQRGAIAIMFAFSLIVLFGIMGLALDLGRLYVVRTELQNAADAAALAGAKELNQKVSGVEKAVDIATKIAQQNKTKFSFNGGGGITITGDNMWVSNCPADTCSWRPVNNVISGGETPAGKTFLKVQIPSGGLSTFFMRMVPAIAGGTMPSTSTFGMAVAGLFVNDVTPIGVCAIDLKKGGTRPTINGVNELTEYGFRRGVSYNIFKLNGPGLPPSNPYLLNPVDVYPVTKCSGGVSSADKTAPFVCTGSSAVVTATPGIVYGNPGVSAGPIEAALNSRFNDYKSPSKCIPAQSPPDKNIMKYFCSGGSCGTPGTPVADWMVPDFDQTIIPLGIAPGIPPGILNKKNYGVLWSYSRAVKAVGTSPDATPDTSSTGSFKATAADWADLYPAPGGPPVPNASFPATGSPYQDPVHSNAVSTGVLNRRVLNMAIIDCPNVSSVAPPGCQFEIPVKAIGRFFMQVPAVDFSGGPDAELNVEFAGLIEPVPTAEIKLYR